VVKVPENSVEQRAYTGARLQPADFGGGRAIAQGAEQLGRGLLDVRDAADKIGEMYDTAAVKKADAEDLRQIMEIKAEALSAKGFDSQPAIADARQKIDAIRRTRLEGLHNSRQRQMYSDVFDQRSLQIEESFANHSVTEIQKANVDAAKSSADANADAAISSYGTPAFEENLKRAFSQVPIIYQGAGPDVIARKQAELQSGVFAKVISGMAATSEDGIDAQAALDANADKLLPADELELRKTLQPKLQAAHDDAVFGQFLAFAGGDPSAVPPEDGQPDADHPNPPAPRQQGEPIRSLPDHLVGGGTITSTFNSERDGGTRKHHALDIATKAGTPIHPPMSGKVIKSWYDGEHGGGWSVLIQHPNGYVTGYAHMRTQSPLAVGAEVESTTTIGSVGSTGHSTGPHLHFTVREHPGGPRVDPQAVDWSAMGGDNGPPTVDPKSVKWKEPALPKYTAEKNTLGTLLQKTYDFAVKTNMSKPAYDRLVAQVKQYAATNEALANERDEKNWDAAVTQLNGLDNGAGPGSGLTDPRKQIPNFGQLEPEKQKALLDIAAQNKNPASVPANGPTYLGLLQGVYDPAQRENFLKTDLWSIPDITPGERASLRKQQLDMANEGPGGIKETSLSTIHSLVNSWFPLPSKPTQRDRDRRTKLYDTVRIRVENEERKQKRDLRPDEVESIVRQETTMVTRITPGKLYGENKQTIPHFEAYGQPGRFTIEIPIAERQRIVEAFRKQYHRDPTSEEASSIYLEGLGNTH
jgi:murein DD-endopeptidase MepM/ murein hydrolase activator NlpD